MKQHIAMFSAQSVDELDCGGGCNHASYFFFVGHHLPSQKESEPRDAARVSKVASA
jgi:hypothetical protein